MRKSALAETTTEEKTAAVKDGVIFTVARPPRSGA